MYMKENYSISLSLQMQSLQWIGYTLYKWIWKYLAYLSKSIIFQTNNMFFSKMERYQEPLCISFIKSCWWFAQIQIWEMEIQAV